MDYASPPSLPATPRPAKSGAAKWVFIGCGGCLGVLALGMVASAAIFLVAMGIIKKTDIYLDAVAKTQKSAEVQAVLGIPIKPGWMLQGSASYNNGSGNAAFTVPLSGPKGKATLVVNANKVAGGPWQYSVFEVQLASGGKIDLREEK